MNQDEQNSLTADERMIAALPVGWKFELAFIAFYKRILLSKGLTPAERLSYLEFIDGCANYLRPAVVAAIEPGSSPFMEIVTAAIRLDPPDSESGSACFECLTRWEVFAGLVKLCPSILDAIKLRVGPD
jgi:hypothetical protein